MRVFSACMKMLRQHLDAFFINILIFALLLFCMVLMGDNSMYGSFDSEKPNYTLINRDEDGPLAEGLAEILAEYGTFVEMEDSKEAMMDAGFYGAVDGIFIIPEGFQEAFWNGEDVSLQYWQYPSSGSGYYLESLAEQYLYMAGMNRKLDEKITIEEAAAAAAVSAKKETAVSMRQYAEGTSVSEKIRLYERFMPYVLLYAGISCVGIVFLNFKRPEIRMRNLCSPTRSASVAVQKLLFTCVISVVIWIVMNVMGMLACIKEWRGLDLRIGGLFAVNSFAVLLVVISLSLLCSCAVRSASAQPFVANMVSLGMSFLSGVFVPLELLSDGILKVAKLLPLFWYEQNVVEIASLTGFGAKELAPVWKNMGMQLGFAAALFVIYLLVNKYMEQAAQSYGSVKTEIEM